RKIDGTLPRHDSEDVEREQGAGGMDLGIGALEKIGDHFRAPRQWLCGGGASPHRDGAEPRHHTICCMFDLIVKSGIFLVALGGKAHVVELHFIDSSLGYKLGERDIVVLDLGV